VADRIFKIILLSFILLAIAGGNAFAASINFTASAVVLSKNQCRFLSNNITLDFGNLDPTSGAVINASTTVNFRCQGSTPIASYAITDDDGMHETGLNANRMQHATNAAQYIPYTLNMSPTSGNVPKNVAQALTIDGTINGPDYATAEIGTYTDLVVISILP
jgi:hypothetical protein